MTPDSTHGLAASIWTARTEAAVELGRRIQSGALFVNSVVASDPPHAIRRREVQRLRP